MHQINILSTPGGNERLTREANIAELTKNIVSGDLGNFSLTFDSASAQNPAEIIINGNMPKNMKLLNHLENPTCDQPNAFIIELEFCKDNVSKIL